MEIKPMAIVQAWPPNIDKIRKAFDLGDRKVVFSYGDILFNPYKLPISDDLMVHERVHSGRQGKNVEEWWDEYIADPEFRVMEELEAYAYQYIYFCKHNPDRNTRAIFLHRIASDLSGPIYGNCISYQDAIKAIRRGTKLFL